MPAWEIEKLLRSHGRTEFDCGKPALNDWLQKYASQYEKKDLERTYVAVEQGDHRVLGYYSVLNHRIRYEALPEDQAKGLPRIDVPVVLLGRLAVDTTMQGQGLGAFLLIDALRRAARVSEQIGIRAIEVDAIDEPARQFYLHYGFTPLVDNRRHLYLPLQVIRKMKL